MLLMRKYTKHEIRSGKVLLKTTTSWEQQGV